MKKIIIAIDGYSSCGKSTMAKELAHRVGYIYIDTGAMYRAVTLYAMREGLIGDDGRVDAEALAQKMHGVHIGFALNPADGSPHTLLNGQDVETEIRTLAVSAHVSPIAALPFVRQQLTEQQRALGKTKGIVMDGRDIGTAVFPQAELKVFVTASVEVRARRRYDELRAKGREVTLDEVRRNVEERDYIDTHRDVSPLRQAPDALVLDNSHLSREEQNDWLLQQFRRVVEA